MSSTIQASALVAGNVIDSGSGGSGTSTRTVNYVRQPQWFEPSGTIVVNVEETPWHWYNIYYPNTQYVTIN